MDFLRSCYSGKLQYIAGDPGAVTTGTWYFCRPGAKAFPGPHAFASPTWDTNHPLITTLGWDATKPRKYYNGRRLNSSPGTVPAGPLEFFRTGAIADGVLPRGVNFTPVECLSPPFGGAKGGVAVPTLLARGGKKFVGFATIPTVPLNCGTFGTPNLTAFVLSGTGYWGPFVGQTATLVYAFGVWTSTNVIGLHVLNMATACGAIVANQFRLDARVDAGPTIHGTPNATTDPFSVVVTFVDGVNVMTVQFSG